MRKILIDTTYIQENRMFDSVSIYIFRLLNAIPEEDISYYTLLILPEIESFIKEKYPQFNYIKYNPYKNDAGLGHYLKFIKRAKIYKEAVNNSGCDILFVPNNFIMFTCAKVKLPKIEVIHDLQNVGHLSKMSVSYWVSNIYYKLIIRNSDKLVAISNYTKRQLLKYFSSLKTNDIDVVYNSIELPSSETCPKELKDNNIPYILYVNALKPYKNVLTLIEAFNLIKTKTKCNLVIVGRDTDYWRNEVVPKIKEYGMEKRTIHLQNIPNEELTYLYRNAALFVTTSSMEGYGYTPIEAAINCCPVLSTHVTALPDTTMDKLNYYAPPTDEQELAKRILELLSTNKDKVKLDNISKAFKGRYAPKEQYRKFKEIFETL